MVAIDTDLDKQCLIATVRDEVALGGKEVIHALKKRVEVYLTALSEAMIKEYMDFGSRWNNREALLARGD
ncbi:hypothetical protein [Heyndrickxia ginsengihumi]|uniref:Uncharacterized protein n=2 Tax=Heyndrickxia ginsengihumi TaxID=363870 RepID=A0A6M0P679_9BACI|nr:hypothetical protein [Heyndrickxia ginsengihumi]MBE6185462.1 hypothetical protein [Bacillus sp. (in: firmicutes)]MCM3024418.1 hypothetical protein [Heyndrickxia ginsengihumi]NEY20226.1 hypothetical protein [Heyndrickxia ginsengihumi]